MLSKSMNNTNSSCRIRRSESSMVEPNMFRLGLKIIFINSIILLFRLANEFFVHVRKYDNLFINKDISIKNKWMNIKKYSFKNKLIKILI